MTEDEETGTATQPIAEQRLPSSSEADDEELVDEEYELGWRRCLAVAVGLVNAGLLALVLFQAINEDADAVYQTLAFAVVAEVIMDLVTYGSHIGTGIGHPVRGLFKVSADLLLAIGIRNIIKDLDQDQVPTIVDILPPLGPWIGGRLNDIARSVALATMKIGKESENITFEHYIWLGSISYKNSRALVFLLAAPVSEAAAILAPEVFDVATSATEDSDASEIVEKLGTEVIWLAVGASMILSLNLDTLFKCCKYKTGKCCGCLGCCWDEWTILDSMILVGVAIPAAIYEFGLVGGVLAGVGGTIEAFGLVYEIVVNGVQACG